MSSGQQGVNFNEFATAAYTWLGRMGEQPGNFAGQLPRAWEKLCQTVALPGMAERDKTMVSELSYTRHLPGFVTPGVALPENARHINNKICFTLILIE